MHIILGLVILLSAFGVVGIILMTVVMNVCAFFDEIRRWLRWR